MWEALRTPYFVVTVDEATRIVCIVRTAVSFSSLQEALAQWNELNPVLDRVGRKNRSLLTDLRLGPARNDPGFEQAMRKVVARMHGGFVRNAVLIRMAAGSLQIRRHAREDGIERLVTNSEEAAYTYLQAGSPNPSGRR